MAAHSETDPCPRLPFAFPKEKSNSMTNNLKLAFRTWQHYQRARSHQNLNHLQRYLACKLSELPSISLLWPFWCQERANPEIPGPVGQGLRKPNAPSSLFSDEKQESHPLSVIRSGFLSSLLVWAYSRWVCIGRDGNEDEKQRLDRK